MVSVETKSNEKNSPPKAEIIAKREVEALTVSWLIIFLSQSKIVVPSAKKIGKPISVRRGHF